MHELSEHGIDGTNIESSVSRKLVAPTVDLSFIKVS